jgi:peptidoglycan/LPS O-acetylase OafA/YrhL
MGLAAWSETSWKKIILWASALGANFFGLWILFLATVEKGTQPVQNPVMLFPLPVALLVWLGILYYKNNRNRLVK